jgi:hypothetical protein
MIDALDAAATIARRTGVGCVRNSEVYKPLRHWQPRCATPRDTAREISPFASAERDSRTGFRASRARTR